MRRKRRERGGRRRGLRRHDRCRVIVTAAAAQFDEGLEGPGGVDAAEQRHALVDVLRLHRNRRRRRKRRHRRGRRRRR